MKTKIYISLIFGIVLFGCSNSNQALHKMNEHELLYFSTSNSLSNYRDVTSIKEIMLKDSTISDYLDLDYKTFKKKYALNTIEMDQLAEALKLTCEIAKTVKSIEDNSRRMESVNIELLNNQDTAKYSFQKVIPLDTIYWSDDYDPVIHWTALEKYRIKRNTIGLHRDSLEYFKDFEVHHFNTNIPEPKWEVVKGIMYVPGMQGRSITFEGGNSIPDSFIDQLKTMGDTIGVSMNLTVRGEDGLSRQIGASIELIKLDGVP